MLNCSTSLRIQHAFLKPCLGILISKDIQKHFLFICSRILIISGDICCIRCSNESLLYTVIIVPYAVVTFVIILSGQVVNSKLAKSIVIGLNLCKK